MPVASSVAAVAAGLFTAWATTVYVAKEVKNTVIENDVDFGYNPKRDFSKFQCLYDDTKSGGAVPTEKSRQEYSGADEKEKHNEHV